MERDHEDNRGVSRLVGTKITDNLEVGEEFTELIGEEDNNKEGSGDSDDNSVEAPSNLFASSSMKSSRDSGSMRRKSRAECVREGLHGLVAAMSTKSTSTTTANNGASLNDVVDLLDSMEEVPCPSDLYFYARRYLMDKGNRTLFLKARRMKYVLVSSCIILQDPEMQETSVASSSMQDNTFIVL